MALKINDKNTPKIAKVTAKAKKVGETLMEKIKAKKPVKTEEQIEFEKIMDLDKATLGKIEKIHPYLVDELRKIYLEIYHTLKGRAICRFTHTLRTFEEQDALYSKGRTTGTKGKTVTNAKGGQSYHNYGCATDICLLVDTNGDGSYETASWQTNVDFDGDGKKDWMEVVDIFEKYGWESGLRWKSFPDAPHFQKTMGYSVQELMKKHSAKDFIPTTNYLNL